MNMTRFAVFVIAAAAVAFAQNTPRAEFEVASIRPSPEQPQGTGAGGVRIDGAQVRWSGLSLKDYIAGGYQVKSNQVSGPDWLGSTRFDIAATLPSGSQPAQIPEMLRNLIEERFQVKVHRDKKDFPVYALEVANGGLKMQESAPDPEAAKLDPKAPQTFAGSGSAQGISVTLGRGSSYTFANNKFEAKGLTMEFLVGSLEAFLDRPIVDMTQLKGKYDFVLDVTEEDYRIMLIRSAVNANVVLPPQALRLLDGASPISLFDAMQKVGLKLDARKAPLDVIVVDDVRKTPTDN
jgi:uncharacterized protein (TIGR03435 family)